MKRFELAEELLTGVQEIDAHHRILLALGNRVCTPSAAKKGDVNLEKELSFLTDYVTYHFAAEEYVMLASGYPGYEHHRQWHERFKRDIALFVNRNHDEGTSCGLALKVSFAIEEWLLEHIKITDAALAKFLKEPGRAPVSFPDFETLRNAGKLTEGIKADWLKDIES